MVSVQQRRRFPKWFGNEELLVNWFNDGDDIRRYGHGVFRSLERYFSEGLDWAVYQSVLHLFGIFAGHLFDSNKGPMLHGLGDATFMTLGFLNSAIVSYLLDALNPTVGSTAGDISRLPIKRLGANTAAKIDEVIRAVIQIARDDWEAPFETAWDFQTLPVLHHKSATLQSSQEAADTACLARFARMKELEEENNRLFIEAYELQDELSPEVPDEQITL